MIYNKNSNKKFLLQNLNKYVKTSKRDRNKKLFTILIPKRTLHTEVKNKQRFTQIKKNKNFPLKLIIC